MYIVGRTINPRVGQMMNKEREKMIDEYLL
jgi:hypothetical protein